MKINSERYKRQILLFGEEGQERLSGSKAFIAGAGGLGSPVATYLTIAGVGEITISDCDSVDLSNLNRQFLHHDKDIGRRKTESAADKLSSMNPDVVIRGIDMRISEDNVSGLVKGCDIIIDCLDNFETRQVLNRAAVNLNIPLVHGGISGWSGQATTVIPHKTACLSCLYPASGKTEIFPVIGPTAGVIGAIQAGEAVRVLTGDKGGLEDVLMLWDGRYCTAERIEISRAPNCPVCGNKEFVPDI
ncbi:HesA/MoeB/ThiF family protein [Methanoplanus limicola]|uniref:UBA/THIF-type NAD/FAD binding protein n=1 Tax=Methanoplanus limicola DSM 2279 TaxID=937775 RepID=H1Z305_9EURY|nr:HesA/MoeB/ThiF family protein [Methanoplanus limicola]EHQ35545.1 UBA/THIF-type NAD/FAD binding protein [Methanoplanus limicola DSM 2279]